MSNTKFVNFSLAYKTVNLLKRYFFRKILLKPCKLASWCMTYVCYFDYYVINNTISATRAHAFLLFKLLIHETFISWLLQIRWIQILGMSRLYVSLIMRSLQLWPPLIRRSLECTLIHYFNIMVPYDVMKWLQ